MNRLPSDEVCRVCECHEGYDRVFDQLDRCQSCGFITFRGFDQEALSNIYNESYFAGVEYPDYLGQQDAVRRSMRRHLAQMARYNPNRGSLLEVGCAYGFFIDEGKRYFENVAGIDICETPTAYARETLGLNVECGEFQAVDFGSRRFDVVCLWDTLEHLRAPDACLKRCVSLLNEDGMVFLTTGDIGSFNARLRGGRWRQIHPPTHLHYFSKSTITRLLNRLGLEVVGIETASYYHTLYNVLASIRIRNGWGGRLAATVMTVVTQSLACRLGFWVNLGDIMFIAARKSLVKDSHGLQNLMNSQTSVRPESTGPFLSGRNISVDEFQGP